MAAVETIKTVKAAWHTPDVPVGASPPHTNTSITDKIHSLLTPTLMVSLTAFQASAGLSTYRIWVLTLYLHHESKA